MPTMRASTPSRKILAVLLTLFLLAGLFCFDSPPAMAKGSLSPSDYVKNVLVYAKNRSGEEILISQLKVSDMLEYLNAHFETYGQVHNYSILDRYVTPVHQEAQGFTVQEFLDYALSKSTLPNVYDLGLSFEGQDSVAFWEIDGSAFDAVDTYTCDDFYGVTRYNFPALYAQWNYTTQAYADKYAIWESRQEEQVLLSITAYSQRYIEAQLKGKDDYDMENYFDNQGILDTARTVRLMLPMTQEEFDTRTPTAANSRYGNCYILFAPVVKPDFGLGKVARPTYEVIDGDEEENDAYDAGYWYFTFSCATEGAAIYYNDNSQSSYMPTALYTPGQEIKLAKKGATPVTVNFRAVKEGCSDVGIRVASSAESDPGDDDGQETVDPNASVWDGVSIDTSWYAGHENDAEYTVATAAELAGLAALANNDSGAGAITFEGKTINLGNHIHLNGKPWSPIGDHTDAIIEQPGGNSYDPNYYDSFNGTFNGNGYTVSGLNPYEEYYQAYWGLFGKTVGATVRDLTVSGAVGSQSKYAASLSGLVGLAKDSTIENCANKATVGNRISTTTTNRNIGGVAGIAEGGLIRDCQNSGAIKGYGTAGGIVATFDGTVIEDCTNTGKIIGSGNTGGIAGSAYGDYNSRPGTSRPSGCLNYGAVEGEQTAVGGIIGAGGADRCVNYGTISSLFYDHIGGIAGSGAQITDCLNVGTVNGSLSHYSSLHDGVGGIAGRLSGDLTGCVNLGPVSGLQTLGGLAGKVSASASVSNSYNRGDWEVKSGASGAVYCGGIAASVDGAATFSKCYDLSGRSVFGELAANANLNKIYYLQGGVEIESNPTADRLGIDPRIASQMKASSFVTALGRYNANGNGTADGWFVSNPGGYPALYWQSTVVSFALTPAGAAVVVKNSEGATVAANPDGTYTLILGETYTYEAAAPGYLSKSGGFTVAADTESIQITLHKDQIAADGPSQIILSWTDDPTTTQTVVWWDNSDENEFVQYVTADSYSDESSFGSANQDAAASKSVGYGEAAQTYYEATMTGLSPGAAYYYRVGSDGNWSDVSAFTTAQPTAEDFSFMYMGDVQHETTAAAEYPIWGSLLTDAYAANSNIAFGLMGGDMVQSGTDMDDWTYFLSYASPVFGKIPLMTANGNHESNFIGGKPQFYLDILALPQNGPAGFEEEFYSFDYGTVHVTVLNSWALSSEQNLDAAQKTTVANWLTNDLAAAQSAKFRIVLLHHPAYALQPDTVSAAVLSEWAPLLEAGKTDLVFCGHQHVYARSYPMRAGEIDPANGVTYVMGNAGQKFYTTADTSYQEKTIFNKSTYQIVDVNGDTLSLSTYDSEGNLVDAWSAAAKSAALAGDINGDGSVNVLDVVQAVNFALGETTPTTEQFNAADTNKDGVINVLDVVQIVNMALGS